MHEQTNASQRATAGNGISLYHKLLLSQFSLSHQGRRAACLKYDDLVTHQTSLSGYLHGRRQKGEVPPVPFPLTVAPRRNVGCAKVPSGEVF